MSAEQRVLMRIYLPLSLDAFSAILSAVVKYEPGAKVEHVEDAQTIVVSVPR